MAQQSGLSLSGFEPSMETASSHHISSQPNYTPLRPPYLPYSENTKYRDHDSQISHSPHEDEPLNSHFKRDDWSLAPQRRPITPVTIPQRRPENKSCGRWMRAYAPSLMDCGIDEMTFLSFLDSFNETCKASPYLYAVNVAAMGVGFAPGIAPMVVGMTVPIAVKFAKEAEAREHSSLFLKHANKELFIPNGLFALIMTYKPEEPSRINIVDSSFTPNTPASTGTYREVQHPTSASLFAPSTPNSIDQDKSQLLTMVDFMSDYNDTRAQASKDSNPSFFFESPIWESHYGDPNHETNHGHPTSMPTGLPGDRRRHQQHGVAQEKVQDRRQCRTRSPNFNGEARSMTKVPGQVDSSHAFGLKGVGMQKDVLYLIIVNYPTASEMAAADFETASLRNPAGQLSQQEIELIEELEGVDYTPIYQNNYGQENNEAPPSYFVQESFPYLWSQSEAFPPVTEFPPDQVGREYGDSKYHVPTL